MAQPADNSSGKNGSSGSSRPAAAAGQRKPKRKALVVGINDYPPPNTLPSCVADAKVMASLLRDQFGFDDPTVLLDEDASKANIVAEVGQLVAGCDESDRLVFFFSGHGYRPVMNGVLESALVTQDAQFFEDGELAGLMKDVPPGILTIITDACFSGGMEKLFVRADGKIEVGKLKRWILLDPQQVEAHRDSVSAATGFSPFGYLTPIPADALTDNFSMAKSAATSAPFSISELRKSDSRAILVSACLEDETAAASTSQTNGLSAFTYALTSTIGSLGAEPSAESVIEASGERLRQIGIKQTPMLKCPPEPANLAQQEFILLNEGGILSTPSRSNGKPSNQTQDDAGQQAIARIVTAILMMTGGVTKMQQTTDNKDWINDVARIATVVAPFVMQSKGINGSGASNKDWIDDLSRTVGTLAPLFMQSKGVGVNGRGASNKDWIDDVTGIVTAVAPFVLQSKGINGSGTLNKDFVGDVARTVGALAPLAPVFFQNKGTGANGNDASKDWIDDATRILNLAHTVANLQGKGFSSGANGASSKDWLNDVVTILPAIAPLLLQSKGFVPNGNGGTDKDFLHDVSRVVQAAAPIVAAVMQTKQFQSGNKSFVGDAIRTVAPLVM